MQLDGHTDDVMKFYFATTKFKFRQYIIEYGSTLYVGMTQKKNGGPIKRVQNLMFRTLPWM